MQDPAILKAQLFGSPTVSYAGQNLQLPSRADALQLIQYLLVHSNRTINRDEIATDIWPRADKRIARDRLRRSCYRLRKHLKAVAHEHEWLNTTRLTIAWSEHVIIRTDVDEYLNALSTEVICESLTRNRAGKCNDFTRDLSATLLENHNAGWIQLARNSLRTEWITALESCLSHLTRSGSHHTAADIALILARKLPPCEHLYRRAIDSYLQANQLDTVSSVLSEVEDRLHSELGISASPELLALGDSLRSSPKSTATSSTTTGMASSERTPDGTLRYSLDQFVDLTHRVESVASRLEPGNCITLVGEGGIGKSRLAIEIGMFLEDNMDIAVWFVSLAEASDCAHVRDTALVQMNLVTDDPKASLDVIGNSDRHSLIILDNCEHVLEGAHALASEIVTTTNARVLATSRSRLGLRDEIVIEIEPLKIPIAASLPSSELAAIESVQLFMNRVKERDPNRLPSHSPTDFEAIAAVCMSLRGLPLAIEIAASHCSLMSVAEVHSLLLPNITDATNPSRTAPARHSTLRTTILWSFRLLDDASREALLLLAIFPSSVCEATLLETLPDLTAISLSDNSLRTAIRQLLHCSLLHHTPTENGALLTLNPLVREVVLSDLLDDAGHLHDIHIQVRYAIAMTRRFYDGFLEGDQAEALSFVSSQDGCLAAAMDICLRNKLAVEGVQIAVHVWRYWYVRGHCERASTWIRPWIEVLSSLNLSTEQRAQLLEVHGTLRLGVGDYVTANPLLEDAVKLYRELGASDSQIQCLDRLAHCRESLGDVSGAMQACRLSISIQRALPKSNVRTSSFLLLAHLHRESGDNLEALRLSKECIDTIGSGSGNSFSRLDALVSLGYSYYNIGMLGRAEAAWHQGLELAISLGSRTHAGILYDALGMASFRSGEFRLSLDLMRSAVAIERSIDDLTSLATTLCNLGSIHTRMGQWKAGELCLDQSHQVASQIQDRQLLGYIACARVELDFGIGVREKEHLVGYLPLMVGGSESVTLDSMLNRAQGLIAFCGGRGWKGHMLRSIEQFALCLDLYEVSQTLDLLGFMQRDTNCDECASLAIAASDSLRARIGSQRSPYFTDRLSLPSVDRDVTILQARTLNDLLDCCAALDETIQAIKLHGCD